MSHFEINMLGGVSLTYCCENRERKSCNETSINSPKMWSLLAFLALNINKRVCVDEITEALWGTKEIVDPQNSIKVLLFKLRKAVESLGFENPKNFIVCKNGSYAFSKDIEIFTDASEFEKLCSSIYFDSRDIDASLLSDFKRLYKGDALKTMQSQTWALSYSTYLHTKFVKTASHCLSILMKDERYEEAADFCRYVTEIEPFHEYFHQCVIISLLKTNQAAAAFRHYNFVCKSYLEFLGQPPTNLVTDTYKLITKALKPETTDVYAIRKELDEQKAEEAFFCDYETFREMYRVAQRTLKRQNESAACGAIVVTNAKSGDSENLLSSEISNLQTFIGKHLRIGDVYTRIDSSKFFILMNGTIDENTELILRRIVRLYRRENRNSKLLIDCISFQKDIKKGLSRFCP